MAINPHDDYEKLAKLLYPSIEASGNVYYGQTRKLTMDEVLKKNELGFNSHVESFRIDETDPYSDYETFLCWELGPLKGSVRVPNILPDVPMCFAKYELSIVKENINSLGLISSGQYSVYEYNTKAIFKSIEITRGKNPIDNSNDWDGANFYIETTPSANYLYIALKVPYSLDEDIEQNTIEIPEYVDGNEFTLVHHPVSGAAPTMQPVTIELKSSGNIANKTVYEYKINSGQWTNITADSTVIDTAGLSDGDTIKIRHRAGIIKSLQTNNDFLYLELNGERSYFDLKGDFRSLQEDKTEIKDHEFFRFFAGLQQPGHFANSVGCDKIVNAKECVIYSEKVNSLGLCLTFAACTNLKSTPKLFSTKLGHRSYGFMFYNCTSLEEVTDIVDFTTIGNRASGSQFEGMFKECTSLRIGPKIYSTEATGDLYDQMFNGCTSLEKISSQMINVKQPYSLSWMFNEMFSGCTSLKKAPDIIVKQLGDNHSFYRTFKDCESLRIPPKITLQSYTGGDDANGSLFEETFSGCSDLISSPIIYAPLNINPVNMCTNMFYGCSNLKNIYLYSEVTSYEAGNFNNWVYNVAPAGNFYYDIDGENELPPSDRFTDGSSGIPTGWNKLDIFKEYRDGEHDIQEHSKYRLNNYIITSGTDSDFNGRGKLSDKSSMLSASSISNIYIPNTYNSDGSYNQEIWGYKSFNSPVQFKNGIYGEVSSMTTMSESDIFNFVFTAYDCDESLTAYSQYSVSPTSKSGVSLSKESGSRLELLNFNSSVYDNSISASFIRMLSDKNGTSYVSAWREDEAYTYDELVFVEGEDESYEYYDTVTETVTKYASSVVSGNASITVESHNDNRFIERDNQITMLSNSFKLTGSDSDRHYISIVYGWQDSIEVNYDSISITGSVYCYNNITCNKLKCKSIEGVIPFPNEISSSETDIPVGSICAIAIQIHSTASTTAPLTFRAIGNSATITWTKHGNSSRKLYCKKYDEDSCYIEGFFVQPGGTITLAKHQYVYVYNGQQYSQPSSGGQPSNYCTFTCQDYSIGGESSVEILGNINSLLVQENESFSNITDLSDYGNYCFFNLFTGNGFKIATVSLPATTLKDHCYDSMFMNCSSLIIGPKELPATALKPGCYSKMFYGCNKLAVSPLLPATSISDASVYSSMFESSGVTTVFCNATSVSSSINSWLPSASGTIYINNNLNPSSTNYQNLNVPNTWHPIRAYGDSIVNGCTGFVIHPGTSLKTGDILSYRKIVNNNIDDTYQLQIKKLKTLYMTQSSTSAYLTYDVSTTPLNTSYKFVSLTGAIQSASNASFIYLLAIRTE